MNNKIKSQEIAKMLLANDKLTISKTKIIIPVFILENYFLNNIVFAKIAIDALASYNSRKGLPPIAAKSIKQSITEKNVNGIIDKYKLTSELLYTSLDIVEKYSNQDVDYAILCNNYISQFYDIDNYFHRKNVFFKYMPVLHSVTQISKSENDIYTGGYCCEEHDGPFDEYLEFKLKYDDLSNIIYKLNKLNIN